MEGCCVSKDNGWPRKIPIFSCKTFRKGDRSQPSSGKWHLQEESGIRGVLSVFALPNSVSHWLPLR